MSVDKLPLPPGKFGTRWVQTILMSASLMVGYCMRLSLSMALVAMTDKTMNPGFKVYDWDAGEKSWILSSFIWGYALAQIPSGYLVSTWSPCKLFSTGFFLTSVVTFLTPFLADYGYIAVCASRAFIGLTQSCFLTCMHVLTSKWAPPLERSRISTYIISGSFSGIVLAMLLSGLIADSSIGWPGIFYTFGGAGVLMSMIFYFNVTDSPTLHPSISQEEKNYIMESLKCAEDDEKSIPRPPWRKIVTSWPMWGIIFAHMGTLWVSLTIQTEIPEYVKSVLNFNMTGNGFISSGYFIASWVMSFPFSWLADYAIIKGVSVTMVRRICNTIAMWGAAAILIILCFVDTLGSGWPIAMLFLAGAFMACVTCGSNVNHLDLSPNFAGAMYAVSNCFGSLASIAAPILCGAITQGTNDPGPWHTVFFVTAGVAFFTNLVFIILAHGETQSWNEKISDPIRRRSVLSLHNTKILEFLQTISSRTSLGTVLPMALSSLMAESNLG